MIFSIILCFFFGTTYAIQVGYSYQPSDQTKGQFTVPSISYNNDNLGNAGSSSDDLKPQPQTYYKYGPPYSLESYNAAVDHNSDRGFKYEPLNNPQPTTYQSLNPNNGDSFKDVGSYTADNSHNKGIISYQPLNHLNPNTFSSYNANGFGSVSPAVFNNFAAANVAPNDPSSTTHTATDYHKEFYVFSAPNNELSNANDISKVQDAAKKTLRVIFIKTPENTGLEKAAIDLAKSALEQKTAIYVLNKDTDLSNLAEKLKDLNLNSPNKPEVHFVKYRTKEDAENAKKAIQSQYDSLNGEAKYYQEGIAPVLNFASNARDELSVSNNPSNKYLPSFLSHS
uniref:DM5 domain-containing protein n=1 Tax=Glossina brevipalpis TaxID=37001 RepID=A0A1A9WLQ9_9MUSC